MKYAYSDLHNHQFEKLVVTICQKLLGIGVQGFAPGPDGGRDAKFLGTAERHPSTASPWVGCTIVQAKHTDGFNRSFSDKNFFSEDNSQSIILLEIESIRSLRQSGELDHYMLFSNRRLTAGANEQICSFIAKECGIPKASIALFGTDDIERFLKWFPEIPSIADLDPIDAPLLVSSEELAEVVEAFAKVDTVPMATSSALDTVDRTTYEEKNKINGLTDEYAASIRRRYLKDTEAIRSFLAAPENSDLLEKYAAAVEDLSLQIISKRKQHQSFDDVMEYVVRQLYDRDVVLKQASNKRITRALIFYMYWNCDIGEVNHD